MYTANRNTAGSQHSKRTTREGSSAHRSVGGGDGNDSHDHRTAAATEDTNREALNSASTGNDYDGSPKGYQSENVGPFPNSEEDGSTRRNHPNGTSSPGRGNRGGPALTTAVVSAAAINPPIAVLGRPNHANFPGLEDTHFGEGTEERGVTVACAVLRSHFEKKEVLKARVNFLLYQVRAFSRRCGRETF